MVSVKSTELMDEVLRMERWGNYTKIHRQINHCYMKYSTFIIRVFSKFFTLITVISKIDTSTTENSG